MSTGWALGLSVLLLIGNAFFVAAEFALISARRTSIDLAADRGVPGARMTLRAMERVSRMMAGAQLGITLCSLGLGALAEPALAHLIGPGIAWLGLPGAVVHPVAFAISLLIVVYLHMVLGEMAPKNFAIAEPDRAALLLGPPMWAIGWLLRPVLILMNGTANLVLRLIKVEPAEEVASTITADQVDGYLDESHDEGLLEENEHRLMAGAVDIHESVARDVMVPLDALVRLTAPVTRAEAEQACVDHGFSRFPILAANGDWIGYVHVKDLLTEDPDVWHDAVPDELIRPLVSVAADTPLVHVLEHMRESESHLALVRDGSRVVGAALLADAVQKMIGAVAR